MLAIEHELVVLLIMLPMINFNCIAFTINIRCATLKRRGSWVISVYL
jgi:hypothetical protein